MLVLASTFVDEWGRILTTCLLLSCLEMPLWQLLQHTVRPAMRRAAVSLGLPRSKLMELPRYLRLGLFSDQAHGWRCRTQVGEML